VIPSASTYNTPSIRITNNRIPSTNTITSKARNPPGLFVSNNGLIPHSAAATAAPTTAASLFASSEAQLSTASLPSSSDTLAEAGAASVGGVPGLSAGQESPRKPGRPRTDTMVYSEGYGNGNSRGSSPIPVVRLGARLNEPGENNDHVDPEEEKAKVEEAEPPRVVEESEPCVVEEKREVAAAVEEPAKDEGDFVPIDDEMVDVGIVDEQEGKVDETSPPVEGIQEETASAVSEPDAEAGPANTEENDTQPSSLRQEQEEQNLGEPEASQPQPQAETTSDEETLPTTLEATVESAEPEETGEVNETAEEPKQGRDAEKELAAAERSVAERNNREFAQAWASLQSEHYDD
jgi:hypothetical protein